MANFMFFVLVFFGLLPSLMVAFLARRFEADGDVEEAFRLMAKPPI